MNLKRFFQIIRKWLLLIVMLTGMAVISAALLNFFVISPVYQAKTVLSVVQPTEEQAAAQKQQDLQAVVNGVSQAPSHTADSYVAQMKTDEVLNRVVQKLQLQGRYTTADMGKLLTVSIVKDANLIEVTATNTDPQLAAELVNSLIGEFLNFLTEKNTEQMNKSVSLLESQKLEQQKNLMTVAEQLKKLQEDPNNLNHLEQQLKYVQDVTKIVRSNVIESETELKQLQAAVKKLEETIAKTPKTIQEKKDEVVVEGETPEWVDVPNPTYTSLVQMYNEKKIALTEKQTQLNSSRASVVSLDKQIQTLQGDVNKKKTEVEAVQKEYDRLVKICGVFDENITKTRIASAINRGETQLSVVSPATAPVKPFKPDKPMNISIAFVASLLASVGIAVLLDYMDNTLKTAEDVRQYLNLPVVGTIPQRKPMKRKGVSR